MVPLVTTFMQITLFGKQPTLLKAKKRLTALHEVTELIGFEIDQRLCFFKMAMRGLLNILIANAT